MDYRQNLDLVAPHIFRKFGQATLALVLAAYAGFTQHVLPAAISAELHGSALTTNASPQSWSMLDSAGQKEFDRGHYEQANSLFQEALVVAQSIAGAEQGNLEHATYEELADLAEASGDFRQHSLYVSKLKEVAEHQKTEQDETDRSFLDQALSLSRGSSVDREDLAAKMNRQISKYIDQQQYKRAQTLAAAVEPLYKPDERSAEHARMLLFQADIITAIGEKPAPGEPGERVWKKDTRNALITSALQVYPDQDAPYAPFLIEATFKLALTQVPNSGTTLSKAVKMISKTAAPIDPNLVKLYAEARAEMPHTNSDWQSKAYQDDVESILSHSDQSSASYKESLSYGTSDQAERTQQLIDSLEQYENDDLDSSSRMRHYVKIAYLLRMLDRGHGPMDSDQQLDGHGLFKNGFGRK